MCLAIPMRITRIDGYEATAERRGAERRVNITLMPDLEVDDMVIIHAGFVIEKLDEEEAGKIDEIWSEFEESLE